MIQYKKGLVGTLTSATFYSMRDQEHLVGFFVFEQFEDCNKLAVVISLGHRLGIAGANCLCINLQACTLQLGLKLLRNFTAKSWGSEY